MQILCILLPPTMALLIGWLIKRERKPLSVWAAEWLVMAVFLYLGTAILFLPVERVAPRIGWNGYGGMYLYIEYGSTAIAVLFAAGVLAGMLLPLLRRRCGISWEKSEQPARVNVSTGGVLIHLLVLFALILMYAYTWGLAHFGNVSMEEIIFHLHVPLQGAAGSLVDSYIQKGLFPALAAFVLFEALVFLPVKKRTAIIAGKKKKPAIRLLPLRMSRGVALAGLALWYVCLILCADQTFGIFEYAASQMKQSELIEEEYVNPEAVQITFPECKRNLITLYVESAETTNQDRENGGIFDVNYIPEMTRIAKENISFSHSDKLEGAAVAPSCGWTIAGLVAETGGLPLKLYEQNEGNDGMDNGLGEYQAFMPGATTLGDILKEAGYRLAFMCGSDFTFGGRRAMYAQHGDYEVYDLLYAKENGVIPEDYHEFWGIEDEKLYAWAKEMLTEMASSDQPFHFSLLTVDTHSPDGYVCRLCPDTYEEQYANVLACSSMQVGAFIDWCMQQPFYEDTSIVVIGDHASMVPDFYDEEYDKYQGSLGRKVYNAFINSSTQPVREAYRMFTTMDFFPTMLASIGAEIGGDRLALGTNLFSDRETLAEQYGYEELFRQMGYKSLFYDNEILYP